MLTVSIVDQVRTAVQKQNRLATLAGFIIGGFVPGATFTAVHCDSETYWPLLWTIILGGLIFSAKTVFEWGRVAFSNGFKAFGFCLLIEGVMTFAHVFWLSCFALALLVMINGIATGCNLALNRKECATARRASLPRPPAKPKETPAPARKKSIRMPKQNVRRKKKAA